MVHNLNTTASLIARQLVADGPVWHCPVRTVASLHAVDGLACGTLQSTILADRQTFKVITHHTATVILNLKLKRQQVTPWYSQRMKHNNLHRWRIITTRTLEHRQLTNTKTAACHTHPTASIQGKGKTERKGRNGKGSKGQKKWEKGRKERAGKQTGGKIRGGKRRDKSRKKRKKWMVKSTERREEKEERASLCLALMLCFDRASELFYVI